MLMFKIKFEINVPKWVSCKLNWESSSSNNNNPNKSSLFIFFIWQVWQVQMDDDWCDGAVAASLI